MTRRAVTRIKSPCSVDGWENKVPTPEGIRDDATCEPCLSYIYGDRVGRSILHQKF